MYHVNTIVMHGHVHTLTHTVHDLLMLYSVN